MTTGPLRYLHDEKRSPLARSMLRSAKADGLADGRIDELAQGMDSVEAPVRAAQFGPAKLIMVSLLAGVVGATAFFGTRRETRPQAASGDEIAASPAVVVVAPVPSALDPQPGAEFPPAVSVDLLPEAPPARGGALVIGQPRGAAPVARGDSPPAVDKAAEKATPAANASSEGDMSDELFALDRIRAALAERRIADARMGLSNYERRFPKKLFKHEANVFEIETLIAEGRRDEAESRARAFLASSPDSPYAARVRSLMAGSRIP